LARRSTLKDVAQRAGVSTATVARVLHSSGYVAAATRELVQTALDESDYQLNAVAQGLRKRRTFAIGHLLHGVSPNPFFAKVALGAEQEAANHGCGVLIYNTRGEPEEERRGVEMLLRRRVDAILFTTVVDERNVELAVGAGVAVVQVERVTPVLTLAVTVDNHRGAFEATEHLVALGHEKIALLGVDPDRRRDAGGVPRQHAVERERLSGYLDALGAHGIRVREALVVLGASYYAIDEARTAVGRWLELAAVERPTAVFATCDILAAGVLQEVYARRLRVPDDLSVVGYDDTYAGHLTPPLTTVEQPMAELGRAAVRLAMTALPEGNGAGRSHSERLATRLAVRSSTGAPRNRAA
jgi:LacI family transcriptional regulator